MRRALRWLRETAKFNLSDQWGASGVGCVRVSCVIMSHNARRGVRQCHVRRFLGSFTGHTGPANENERGHVAADLVSCHDDARNR